MIPKNYLADDDDDSELHLPNRHLQQQSGENRIMGVSRHGNRRNSLDYINDDDLLDVHDDIDLGSVDMSPSSDSKSTPTNTQEDTTIKTSAKSNSNQDIFDDVYDSFGDTKKNSFKTSKRTIITSDEEGQYETQSSKSNSINIDETIVKSVLNSSESRSKKLQREILTKKYVQSTLKGFIYVCAFMAFIFVILLIANPSSSNKHNFTRYDDHDYFHDHDNYESILNNVLNEPIQFDERIGRSEIFAHLKNREEELDVGNEVPYFWKVPFTGDVVERVMSQCFGFVLASDMIGQVMPAALINSDEVCFYALIRVLKFYKLTVLTLFQSLYFALLTLQLQVYNVDNIPYVNVGKLSLSPSFFFC